MAKRLRSAIACGPEGSADSGLVLRRAIHSANKRTKLSRIRHPLGVWHCNLVLVRTRGSRIELDDIGVFFAIAELNRREKFGISPGDTRKHFRVHFVAFAIIARNQLDHAAVCNDDLMSPFSQDPLRPQRMRPNLDCNASSGKSLKVTAQGLRV